MDPSQHYAFDDYIHKHRCDNIADAQVLICRMKSAEAQAASDLFREVLLELPYYNKRAKETELARYSADFLRQSITSDRDSVLLAKAGGVPVGFCFSRDDDGVVWLSWFGVRSSFRHCGVGTALLIALERSVATGRSHKIWCDCRTENCESISVLTANKYVQLCTVREHWYGQDFILWEKFVS
jgi:hypothetical protein